MIGRSLGSIFLRFLIFGFFAWGGPVAQIAMLRKELVEKEKWVSKTRFNHALALYQVLPGPEATEMAVYFGYKRGGLVAGLLAGLGFVLPGFFLMLLLSWAYVYWGAAWLSVVFLGVQPAVAALVARATVQLSKHTLTDRHLWALGGVSAAVSFLGVPFWLTLLFAGVAYFLCKRRQVHLAAGLAVMILLLGSWSVAPTLTLGLADSSKSGGWWGFLPLLTSPADSTPPVTPSVPELFFSGLKAGLLTFGGAYTVIPFVQADAVQSGWLTNGQFLDGLALSGLLPAPLIIFATFVGFFTGGWPGALAMSVGIFLPAFAFTLLGHGYLERIVAQPGIRVWLDGITAGVIGLIAATAIVMFFAAVHGVLGFVLFGLALAALFYVKSKWAVPAVILTSGVMGLFASFLQV